MFKGIIVVSFLGILYCAKAQTINIGDTIPAFNTFTVDSQFFALDTTLKRTTILLFWNTWNGPSTDLLDDLKEQYQFINPLKKGIRQQNIDVIDFCADVDKELHVINLKRSNLPWPIHLADYKGWESPVMNQLRITKTPTLMILDEKRKVIVIDPDPKQLRSILSNIKLNTLLSN
jgi:Thioredoxin-like